MPPNKMSTKKFSIVLPEDIYENLTKAAKEKHITVSELIRTFVSKCLTVEWAENSENTIREILREEIKEEMTHHIERLIKVEVKSAKSSISVMYLLLLLIQNDYADESTTEDLVAAAFKQAAGYLKLTEQPIEDYIREAREFIIAGNKLRKKDDS